jgi:hypothetical protein
MEPDPIHADIPEGNKPFREKWYFYPVWKQSLIWTAIALSPWLAIAAEVYMSLTMGARWGIGLIGVQAAVGVGLAFKAVYEIGFATARARFSSGDVVRSEDGGSR